MSADERSRFEVIAVFDAAALHKLEMQFGKTLEKLHTRYLHDRAANRGYVASADYLDALRIAWLLDKSWLKVSTRASTKGFGYAFGRLLSDRLGMKWCLIKDGYGETISMDYFGSADQLSEYEKVSFPPFNFIAKRERSMNGDVFADGLALAQRMISGGCA
jgi:hypothetical protein